MRIVTVRQRTVRIASLAVVALVYVILFGWHFYAYGQDKTQFPGGFDAAQAAPNSHKVIFENSLVRVLEVTVPAASTTEPVHHHRWPSFFLSWDTGGCTPYVRYHHGDGTVTDEPSHCKPVQAGVWRVQWMKPEPMHAIETIENPGAAAYQHGKPPLLRVEIKDHP